MLCSPRRDLDRLGDELMACFRETKPGREFHAALFLGLVRMHLVVADIEKTRDLTERRNLIHEFKHGQKTIEKAIALLRRTPGAHPSRETARRSLP